MISPLWSVAQSIAGRLWGAFFGFGSVFSVKVCTDPHLTFWFDGMRVTPGPPHLDIHLRVWNKGVSPTVTVIHFYMKTKTTQAGQLEDIPKTVVLDRDGTPVSIEMRFYPVNAAPLATSPGDVFTLELEMNSGLRKRFSTAVAAEA